MLIGQCWSCKTKFVFTGPVSQVGKCKCGVKHMQCETKGEPESRELIDSHFDKRTTHCLPGGGRRS